MTNTPIFYTNKEMTEPAKPVAQKPIQAPLVNAYIATLYTCGEALL